MRLSKSRPVGNRYRQIMPRGLFKLLINRGDMPRFRIRPILQWHDSVLGEGPDRARLANQRQSLSGIRKYLVTRLSIFAAARLDN